MILFDVVFQVHHGGAGTTAAGLKAAVSAYKYLLIGTFVST